MIWKDIRGWKWQYQVNRKGVVKSLSRPKRFVFKNGVVRYLLTKEILLKPYLGTDGYLYYYLSNTKKNSHFAKHRLIAMYFIPNPLKKKEVNHKNCKRTDNSIRNLEWATRKENSDHSIKNSHYNICKPGTLNPASKLTDKQVIKIRKSKGTQDSIALRFGVSRRCIGAILKGQRWKHLL